MNDFETKEMESLRKENFRLKTELEKFKQTFLLTRRDWTFGQIIGGLSANPNLAELSDELLVKKARRIHAAYIAETMR